MGQLPVATLQTVETIGTEVYYSSVKKFNPTSYQE
jgi:hypothetical protein